MSVLIRNHDDNGFVVRIVTDSVDWPTHQHYHTPSHSLHSSYSGQLTRLTAVNSGRNTLAFVAILLLAWVPQAACATWKTGEAFHRGLREPITLTWDQAPLRDALMRLADAQSVAIFLDRRVDPETKVTIQLENVALDDAVRQIARQRKLGVGYVGSVIYIGPARAAARVATLAEMRREDGKQLAEKLRARMTKSESMQWERLSEPRWIVRKLCAEAGISLADVNAIPHDLWPAYHFPEMTLYERLTLVLANFGFTFRIDADTDALELVSIPRAVAVERVYAAKDLKSDTDDFASKYPQAIMRVRGDQIFVVTTVEDHWAIANELGAGQAAPEPTPLTSQRFTLTVKEQPMGWLCEQVGKRVGLNVDFGEQPAAVLEQRVSFAVQKVTLQELFESIVQPAGLEVTIEQGTVRIR